LEIRMDSLRGLMMVVGCWLDVGSSSVLGFR
jgi:hypothetical protein